MDFSSFSSAACKPSATGTRSRIKDDIFHFLFELSFSENKLSAGRIKLQAFLQRTTTGDGEPCVCKCLKFHQRHIRTILKCFQRAEQKGVASEPSSNITGTYARNCDLDLAGCSAFLVFYSRSLQI